MTSKNLYKHITDSFPADLKTISELSKSSAGKSLVNNEKKLYDYDSITKKVYHEIKVPSSADALLVTDRQILLTEYKSGFKRHISKKTLDYSQLTCPDDPSKICHPYADLLVDKGNLECDELLDSLKFKALESYITLEKKLFPLCNDNPNNKKTKLIYSVVIDDYVDSMEDTLTELASTSSDTNSFSNIRNSLSRFVGLSDTTDEDYYYDEIKVFNPHEYNCYITPLIS